MSRFLELNPQYLASQGVGSVEEYQQKMNEVHGYEQKPQQVFQNLQTKGPAAQKKNKKLAGGITYQGIPQASNGEDLSMKFLMSLLYPNGSK